jgi:hypothetical protein
LDLCGIAGRVTTKEENQISTTPQTLDKPSTSYAVLGAASVCHMLNDMMQSLFVAAYPIFKGNFHLSFTQIGHTDTGLPDHRIASAAACRLVYRP